MHEECVMKSDLCRMCLAPVTVGPNVHSYVLMGLASETNYVVNVMVSTVAGSVKGMDCTFKTMKYGMSFVLIFLLKCLMMHCNFHKKQSHAWSCISY